MLDKAVQKAYLTYVSSVRLCVRLLKDSRTFCAAFFLRNHDKGQRSVARAWFHGPGKMDHLGGVLSVSRIEYQPGLGFCGDVADLRGHLAFYSEA